MQVLSCRIIYPLYPTFPRQRLHVLDKQISASKTWWRLDPTHRSASPQFSNQIAGLCEEFAGLRSVSVDWLGRILIRLDSAIPDTLYIGRYSVYFHLQFRNVIISVVQPSPSGSLSAVEFNYLCMFPISKITRCASFQDYRSSQKSFDLWQASLRSKEVRTGVGAVFKPFAVDRKRANRYEIPRGSWFEWVSCAHYSAEIVRFFFFSVAFSLSLIKGQ